MSGRDELEAALRASAAAPVPEPDEAFVRALEQRLLTGERSNVVPIARRARRVGTTAIVTATVVFAGAAAAAGVAITHPFRHEAPVEVSTTVTGPPTTSPGSTTLVTAPVVVVTTAPAPRSTLPGVPSTASSPTTVAPVTTMAPTTAVPPTTVRAALPPTTTAAPATSTTEVRVPATITLTCGAAGSTVHCSWVGAPAGMDHYGVLRSQPGTGNGRVYFVPAGTTTWTDPIATAGTTATYLVHAFTADNVSLGHSNAVSVPCC